jgi:hypothetical protein
MSFQAWLRSVGGVGYKKGDVDLVDELTGVQTYFDPARELYWDVRRQGPIRGPDGKPIEEVAQVAAMADEDVAELLLRLIPPDVDPSTKLDRRMPMRDKLRDAIASLPKSGVESRRRSGGGISWADEDAEPQDEQLWGTADKPKSAEEIVRRSMTDLRKQRQRKREGKQREARQDGPPRNASGGAGGAPRDQEHLRAAWEASTRPGITPGVGLLKPNQVGQPIRETLAVQPAELTDGQKALLAEVQSKYNVPNDRDRLYAATRQHLEQAGGDYRALPSKRQIACHFLRNPVPDHARWNTSSLNGVLGHNEYMQRPPSPTDSSDAPTGKRGARDHRLGKGSWLGPELDRLPLGGAPELEAAWNASVGPPKAQVVAARRAAARAAERGDSGQRERRGRSGERRWVHDHDVPRGEPALHDDDWAERQIGDDMGTHTHFSELVRAQQRNEQYAREAEADPEAAAFSGRQRQPLRQSRAGSSSSSIGGGGGGGGSRGGRSQQSSETVTIVRDAKELRQAVASKTGTQVVELAAGVTFVLTDKPYVPAIIVWKASSELC